MKKQILLGAFLLGSLFTAQAQEPIFDVDFSSVEVLGDWFLINADGDNNNWGVNTTANEDATAAGFSEGFAFSRSWNNAPLTPDNSLITQAFTVPAEGGAYASFKIGAISEEFFAEHYAVYVITEEDFAPIIEGLQAEPATATTDDFIAILGTAAIEETLTTHMAAQKTVNLAEYAGQELRLVFRHYDVTDQLIIILDDVAVITGELGTNNVLASQFSVFPNPTTGVINIANADNMLVNAASIVDINGRTVKTAKFDNVSEAQINISDLAAGVYMMNISSDKGTTTKKIVKN